MSSGVATTVRELIDHRADQHPERFFVYSPESTVHLSYARLQQQCRSLNRFLNDQGIGPGETVAFLMDNGTQTVSLFLGLMYCGRVALPLNAVAGQETLDYVLQHSGTRLCLVSSRYLEEYSTLFEAVGERAAVVQCDEDPGLIVSASDEPCSDAVLSPDSLGLLIYTSGTTGRPKGVMLSHRNVIAGGTNTTLSHNLDASDIGLCVLPMYHINAEMVSVMAPLVSGGSVVMPHRLSIGQFWQWIIEFKCTWFSIVPTVVSYLIDHRQRHPDEVDMDKVRESCSFGRSASAALPESIHRRFEALFEIPIVETMGISEAAAQILSNPMPPASPRYGSPGRAVGNKVRIVNETNQPVENGVKGEIVVQGDNVMLGYLNNPDETEKTIDAGGWMHTGDVGYIDDEGFVYVTGRIKELIIKGGENISPGEIDNILYRHPDVLEAAAFGIPDENYGQEVAACVVLRDDREVNAAELIDYCTNFLGGYKTPKQIAFATELPKGPSGKIQRLKVAERYLQD